MRTFPRPDVGDIDELVETHQDGLRRYLRFLRCPTDRIDDLVQEAFLCLLRSNLGFSDIDNLAGWLRRAAHRRYVDGLRRWRRRRRLEVERLDAAWAEIAGDDEGQTYLAVLRECMSELEARARRALDMKYRGRASRAAIGAALGLSVAGVKALLTRTKDALGRCVRRKALS